MTSQAFEFMSHHAGAQSWLGTLDAFAIPFLSYGADGNRLGVSRGAAGIVARVRDLAEQADRVARGEVLAPRRCFDLGRVTLAREIVGGARGVVLAVYLLRPVIVGVRAVVVLRPGELSIDASSPIPGLTRREAEVARMIASGLATKEIAHRLGLSCHTARHHTERVFAKLGVRTRSAVSAVLNAHYDAGCGQCQ